MDGTGIQDRPEFDDASAGTKSGSNWKRRVNTAAMLGWTVSLIIHVVAIVGIGKIGWMYGGDRGNGDVEVAIVEYESGDELESLGQQEQIDQSVSVAPSADMPEVKVELGALMPTEDAQMRSEVLDSQMLNMDTGTAGLGNAWQEASLSGGGAAGSGGASFFGLEVSGTKFVYVVDRSGSMRGEPLNMAKTELRRSISELEEFAEFFVIFYSGSHIAMPGGELVEATEENKEDCYDWLESITGSGSTDPTSAMELALSLNPDAVWLLSDGQFNSSMSDHITRYNKQRGVVINTIAFLNRSGEAILKQIANKNDGKYRFVAGR
ncbi:marine proteobacterial sortase target protein [Anaerohalosphaera lusitana]|uniref:Marine proteobacterial sortase target protein n=1 Tax=Anaerohalosphaera lusitana TaxID=1936003 RepID=A0A1U9NPR7_9BACT|nr:VWA domain-containing protein [Anaerohalosphaera lusitana]AQT69506.1 marine proteobacterial sortase target protein [Anaerohalosphaera lusitana]